MSQEKSESWLKKTVSSIQKTTRQGTRILLIYLLLNLVTQISLQIMQGTMEGNLSLTMYISDGINQHATIIISWYSIIETILLGPWLSIIMVFCFEKQVSFLKNNDFLHPKKETLLKILFVISISALNAGVLMNRTFNILDAMLKELFHQSGQAQQQFVYVYFLDELLGHSIGHLGISLFLITLALSSPHDSKIENEPIFRTNGGERVLILISAIVYGVLYSYAILEGQSACLIIIINLIGLSTLITIFLKKSKEINILNRPFLLFLFFQTITMIAFVFIWGLIFGLKPFYPYFFQPTEIKIILPI
ncbi:MAG: hypothetical protein ACTSVI_17395 [Promethearchaeota archaeon]